MSGAFLRFSSPHGHDIHLTLCQSQFCPNRSKLLKSSSKPSIACERPASLTPGDIAGCENIGDDETFDGDYGRVLERAYEKRAKVLASPTGFEPVFWP